MTITEAMSSTLTLPLCGDVGKRSEQTARLILRHVHTAGLVPGETLPPLPRMAEMFEVSVPTLREALRVLEVNGLVEHRSGPGGGYVVCSVTPREFGRVATLHFQALGLTVGDLIAARVDVEPTLAALAASCSQEAVRAQLAEQIRDEALEFQKHSIDFHGLVMTMSGLRGVALWAQAMHDIINLRLSGIYTPCEQADIRKDHVLVGHAILDRDPVAARRLMREHFQHVASLGKMTSELLYQPVTWR